jgi:acyl CoA:acetate/3-ketoacid CoA transferase beta subunit
MSDYEDELWLTTIHPLATLEQIERFCERVAIKMADGISEVTARNETYKEIFCE